MHRIADQARGPQRRRLPVAVLPARGTLPVTVEEERRDIG
jgi:hypothetical protein